MHLVLACLSPQITIAYLQYMNLVPLDHDKTASSSSSSCVCGTQIFNIVRKVGWGTHGAGTSEVRLLVSKSGGKIQTCQKARARARIMYHRRQYVSHKSNHTTSTMTARLCLYPWTRHSGRHILCIPACTNMCVGPMHANLPLPTGVYMYVYIYICV